ncbi:hypothetical protein LUZ60_004429 [Juncus effusus]|nr:hypothetical protein LUZ60_004429 [Juncus effusus]
MALVLHAGQGGINAYKSLIAAEYSGVKVEHVNALEKVSVLETPDGPVFESNAMARYIAKLKGDNTLFGSSVYDYAQIEQWLDFAATEIDQGIKRWINPRMGLGPYCGHSVQWRVVSLKKALRILDTHLAGTCYLVGHGITLADIVMTCILHFGFTCIMTKSFTSEFPHVERYFWMLVNQPNFKKILGEVKQVESVAAVPEWTMKQVIDARYVMANQIIGGTEQNGDVA